MDEAENIKEHLKQSLGQREMLGEDRTMTDTSYIEKQLAEYRER